MRIASSIELGKNVELRLGRLGSDLERWGINSDAQLQLEMPSTLKNERDRLQGKLEGIQEVSQRYDA